MHPIIYNRVIKYWLSSKLQHKLYSNTHTHLKLCIISKIAGKIYKFVFLFDEYYCFSIAYTEHSQTAFLKFVQSTFFSIPRAFLNLFWVFFQRVTSESRPWTRPEGDIITNKLMINNYTGCGKLSRFLKYSAEQLIGIHNCLYSNAGTSPNSKQTITKKTILSMSMWFRLQFHGAWYIIRSLN